jgi:BirA family biotin operon repressor/biotin-[acetyl-CoA-carboxylase] ligase
VTVFGKPRRHVAVCESTNDLARTWAADPTDPAPHGALVTADFQTRGRGRRGHRWDAAASESALMSFVLRPRMPLTDAWHLGFLAGLATATALERLGLEARLKWPNDILLNDGKVAGVLVETVLQPGGSMAAPLAFAIAGIGLNVSQEGFDAESYAYPPTSLRLASGKEWDSVIELVAAELGHWDTRLRQQGFEPILSACQERLAVGAAVRCGEETAVLVGLTEDGHAQVRRHDGTFAEWLTLET